MGFDIIVLPIAILKGNGYIYVTVFVTKQILGDKTKETLKNHGINII